MIQAFGVVEVVAHLSDEHLFAVCYDIEEVTNRDHFPQGQLVALAAEQVHHGLQRRTVSLQRTRDRHQGLD